MMDCDIISTLKASSYATLVLSIFCLTLQVIKYIKTGSIGDIPKTIVIVITAFLIYKTN